MNNLTPTNLNQILLSISDNRTYNFKPVKLSFTELHTITSYKTYYSSGSFLNGHRNGDNFRGPINCLIFDIDEGWSIQEAKDFLIKANLKAFISTTKSHQKMKGSKSPCDRFRIFMPLKYVFECNKEEYERLMKKVCKFFLSKPDPQALDAARTFAGNLNPIYEYIDGEACDVNSFMEDLIMNKSSIKILSLNELIENKDLGNKEWIIDGFLAKGRAALISGKAGSFKSYFSQEIARAVSTGGYFLGKFKCNKGKVLIIDKENPLDEVKKRMIQMQIDKNSQIYFIDFKEVCNIYFDGNEEDINELIDWINREKFDLVIMDSYVRFAKRAEENSASDIRSINEKLKILIRSNISVVILDHQKKSNEGTLDDAVRGSGEKVAFVDYHYSLKKIEKSGSKITITNAKNRESQLLKEFTIQFFDKPNIHFEEIFEDSTQLSKKEEISRETIIEFLKEGSQTRKSLINKVLASKGYSESRTDILLKELIEENKIYFSQDSEKKEIKYSLSSSSL